MRIIKINSNNPSLETIKIAAKVLKNGGVIIYPTDTIYGLGASALDKNSVKKIYEVKKRPATKPLSIVVKDIKMAKKYCAMSKKQEEIFSSLLPGPFTLIFKKCSDKCPSRIFTGYKNTFSVRIPDYKITALLAKELKIPLTSTSANISGLPGSGDINKVLRQLENKKNRIDLVLDAGVLPKKNSSTIIDLTGNEPKIIRK
ncbi:MAG: L-threonylcarbamoyladenylate synthase [Patescibacteria group bacterium]|nr:threonylcarbamoyl-AMP synthase [Patescibacteria group bacterium]MBU4141615.1 threonylcarbamoyl-AMP synthase [Patescibacteria group bacterium]